VNKFVAEKKFITFNVYCDGGVDITLGKGFYELERAYGFSNDECQWPYPFREAIQKEACMFLASVKGGKK